MEQFMTIGLAGHIDHGKTALTKALTGIETDRLKEEQARHISIENGFAYYDISDGQRAAVIDVPGHERFIRQMIAGVVGIDLVLIVIAADEGMMPQTKEHLAILHFLNITKAIVVITKIELVDDELLTLVRDDIQNDLEKNGYGDAPVFEVDSLSKIGINELKDKIRDMSTSIKPKNSHEPFRLPIDDVFTLHGQGTIVRGTIFNGTVNESDDLLLLPQDETVRVRQLQVHHEKKLKAYASQRVAINLGGVPASRIHRGDVLVSSRLYQPTNRIDVYLETTSDLKYILKQRSRVMCHLGTAAVMGKLILFDRNQLSEEEAVYCQIELTQPIVTKRDDRFIIRRPSPVETIGGGWVIDTNVDKHRFGIETVRKIKTKAMGTPEERIRKRISDSQVISSEKLVIEVGLEKNEFEQHLSLLKEEGKVIPLTNGFLVDISLLERTKNVLIEKLKSYHQQYPLRIGMNKAEWLREAAWQDLLLKEAASYLEKDNKVVTKGPLIKLMDFNPSYPDAWAKRMTSIVSILENQGLKVDDWQELCEKDQLPKEQQDELRHFLIQQKLAFEFDKDNLIHTKPFLNSIQLLKKSTKDEFSIKEAKDILGLSRKYMIPYLELCDSLGYTVRGDGVRKWLIMPDGD